MLESAAFALRKPLRTTLITLADAKSSPGLHRFIGAVTRFVNRFLGGDLRWQTLPVPFEVYADGIDLVVFEEFGAGQAALHLADEVERNALMDDEAYRRRFRRDYEQALYRRACGSATSTTRRSSPAPTPSVVGTLVRRGRRRARHPSRSTPTSISWSRTGRKLRWRTTIANHRPREVARMIERAGGAHRLRRLGRAHPQHGLLQLPACACCKVVRDAERAGRPVMPIERAVWRLTGEIGDWLGVDAGRLRVGDRADVAVIDPSALDERLDAYHEAPMENLGNLQRMVNRSDGAVRAVLVGGRVAFDDGAFDGELGRARGFGSFLPAEGDADARAASDARKSSGAKRPSASCSTPPPTRSSRSATPKRATQEVCKRAERLARAGCSATSPRARR